MANIIVGQSGGPTAVINSSLFGVYDEASSHPEIDHVYGMLYGIEGFLKGMYMDMATLSDEDKNALQTTPGAYLGSCRYKLPKDLSDPVYPKLFEKFKELDISYFFYIGGNDSMDTVSKLSCYASQTHTNIRIVGIPKTIDNDLIITDHTPGFGSAAKYVASTIREISHDIASYDMKSIAIVEIMGRHAGWLTASSALARQNDTDNPVLIYLPETVFDEKDFLVSVEKAFLEKSNLIICVSEGLHDAAGQLLCEKEGSVETDSFGHKMLAGCGKYLAGLLKEHFDVKIRSIDFNLMQRCSSACISATDLSEAETAGRFGVKTALEGKTGFMAAFKRVSDDPYTIECIGVDVDEVCNKEKTIPLSWITKNGTDVSEEFIAYVKPLIQCNCERHQKDGLPYFACRSRENL